MKKATQQSLGEAYKYQSPFEGMKITPQGISSRLRTAVHILTLLRGYWWWRFLPTDKHNSIEEFIYVYHTTYEGK